MNMVDFLKAFNEKIYYYPNPGNAGDSLIAAATFQYFAKHDIDYEIVENQTVDLSNKIVAYGGGGNFGGASSRVGLFVEKWKDSVKTLIILPHTIFGAENLLKSMGDNCYIFCREEVSYKHVLEHVDLAQVFLHDDMVFSSSIRELMNEETTVKFGAYLFQEFKSRLLMEKDADFGLSLKGFLSFQWFRLKDQFQSRPQSPILYAFRSDVEKTDVDVPNENADLSAILELSSCKKDLALLSCSQFLKTIDSYSEVYTNRLHVAIASILLGKKVKLYGNNYYKIRAIYDFSIYNKFDNVEWCD